MCGGDEFVWGDVRARENGGWPDWPCPCGELCECWLVDPSPSALTGRREVERCGLPGRELGGGEDGESKNACGPEELAV